MLFVKEDVHRSVYNYIELISCQCNIVNSLIDDRPAEIQHHFASCNAFFIQYKSIWGYVHDLYLIYLVIQTCHVGKLKWDQFSGDRYVSPVLADVYMEEYLQGLQLFSVADLSVVS